MARKEQTSETPNFSLYLMFSEGVQFNSAEIAAAVLEDFPSLEINDSDGLSMPMACDTDDTIPMAPIFMGASGPDAAIVNMMRLPGFGTWDPAAVQPRQMLACTDIDLRAALTRNRSYLCISAGAKSTSVQDTFRAARLVSCVGAVFAQLPICLGAYWETGDHFVSPKGICDMANSAIRDEWPLGQWVGIGLNQLGADKAGRQWSTGTTLGLRHFTDYEIQLVAAPLDAAKLCATLWSISWLPVASGNVLSDGDTTGVEGGADAEKLRLRWLPKGSKPKKGKAPPQPYNSFIAIHPESPFDEAAYFGKGRGVGKRKQVVSNAPRPGFFKRMMGSGHA